VLVKLSMNDMMKLRGREGFRPPQTTTDDEGRFELKELSAGKVSIISRAEGFAESEPATLDLQPEQELTDASRCACAWAAGSRARSSARTARRCPGPRSWRS
jgi:hypothetical protein